MPEQLPCSVICASEAQEGVMIEDDVLAVNYDFLLTGDALETAEHPGIDIILVMIAQDQMDFTIELIGDVMEDAPVERLNQ